MPATTTTSSGGPETTPEATGAGPRNNQNKRPTPAEQKKKRPGKTSPFTAVVLLDLPIEEEKDIYNTRILPRWQTRTPAQKKKLATTGRGSKSGWRPYLPFWS